ncbi:hypothetical protein HK100_000455 [Physocladia obscura]|uniref:Uncharacterized protein n=1 Tax=Physocladia obscura TaxID=109957 RepID=A0AAD5T149_9FUNG|nr:hypothetical protein HK100_000455 [Physocladia obscura]
MTIETAFLQKFDRNHKISILGKNGEPRTYFSTEIFFKHEYFTKPISKIFTTDEKGIVDLGTLDGIVGLALKIGDTPEKVWDLSQIIIKNGEDALSSVLIDRKQTRPDIICEEGVEILIPLNASAEYIKRTGNVWDFVQRSEDGERGILSARDAVEFKSTSAETCDVIIRNLKEGIYTLNIIGAETKIIIKKESPLASTFQNEFREGSSKIESKSVIPCKLGVYPRSSAQTLKPVHISSIAKSISPNAPGFHLKLSDNDFGRFPVTGKFEPVHIQSSLLTSGYSQTQTLQADLEYVLKRRAHLATGGRSVMGNTLERPIVLLDSWKIRDTSLLSNQLDGIVEAQSYMPALSSATIPKLAPNFLKLACVSAEPYKFGMSSKRKRSTKSMKTVSKNIDFSVTQASDFSNYDFLAKTGSTLFNLKPDADGVVFVPVNENIKCEISFLVVDSILCTVSKVQIDGGDELNYTETAIKPSWPIESAISEILEVSPLPAGIILNISLGADYAVISDISQLYSLAESLNKTQQILSTFRFITNWSNIPYKTRLALFSEYSCHELNFFETVVKPHIASKSTKSFIDHFLLDDAATCLRAVENISVSWIKMNTVERILFGWLMCQKNNTTYTHAIEIVKNWANDCFRSQCLSSPHLLKKHENIERVFSILKNSNEEKQFNEEASDSAMNFENDEDGYDSLGEHDRSGVYHRVGARRSREVEHESVYFEPPPQTNEFGERHYWNSRGHSKNLNMNHFWHDFSNWAFNSEKKEFLSNNVDDFLTGDFTEIMFGIAISGVGFKPSNVTRPFETQKIDVNTIAISSAAPSVVYHKEFKESDSRLVPSILCNIQYFDPENSQTQDEETREMIPRYIDPKKAKFLSGKVYGMEMTLTNTMAVGYNASALVSIPSGSLAVKCFAVKKHNFTLKPFTTAESHFHFYFPAAGEYWQFPIHVSDRKNFVVASSPAFKLSVLETIEKSMLVDAEGGITWSYISEHGSNAEVLDWLKTNEDRFEVSMASKILFRCGSDEAFWQRALEFWRSRGAYYDPLWAFGMKFHHRKSILEWLMQRKPTDLPYIKFDEIVLDNYETGLTEVVSYWPLVNARAHEIGQRSRVNNKEFMETYKFFIGYLINKPVNSYSCLDHVSLICYLLLQDRFGEALVRFKYLQAEIASSNVTPDLPVQIDYLAAWFDFLDDKSGAKLEIARSIAVKYKDYPVKQWNELFAAVLSRTNEYNELYNNSVSVADVDNPKIPLSINTESALSFNIIAGESGALGLIKFAFNNIKKCFVQFHTLNLEMEFSSRPFTTAARFKGFNPVSNIADANIPIVFTKSQQTMEVEFPAGSGELTVEVPNNIKRGNVAVEVFALNGTISQTRVSSDTKLTCMFGEKKGVVQILRSERQCSASVDEEWALSSSNNSDDFLNVKLLASRRLKPVGSVYVKVYARLQDSREIFYKDGYSDLLGRFEYVSLSNSAILTEVKMFAILISSEEYGDAVYTAKPPKV